MRKQRAFTPIVLDRLEDRVVLSHAVPAPSQVGAIITLVPQNHVIELRGTVNGFATRSPLATVIPGSLLLNGRGNVTPIGAARLVGTLSIRSGEPTFYDGTVFLFHSRGIVEVQISGIVGGPSGPPAHLHYKILAGWGAYRGATGMGDVVYDQGLARVNHRTPFSLTFAGSTPTTT